MPLLSRIAAQSAKGYGFNLRPSKYIVSYLSVAGGGSGGTSPVQMTSEGSGGGGGGGVGYGNITFLAGVTYTFTVGSGGSGSTNSNGGDSIISGGTILETVSTNISYLRIIV
jgi:hypothetical protein